MKKLFTLLIAVSITIGCHAQNLFNAPIIASDITNFWSAFDEFEKDTTKNPFVHYLQLGTPGLADISIIIGGGDKMKKHVVRRMDYYKSIRPSSNAWMEYQDKINYVSQQLKMKIPTAELPTIYLVMGRENCGGTVTGNGVIVGYETFCYSDAYKDPMNAGRTLENLPETIAFLMAWSNISGGTESSLTQQCIAGGIADFLSKELTKDLKIKKHGWTRRDEYGATHACELWKSFLADRNKREFIDWFWQQNSERPQEMGYWIGFKIVEAYYQENKTMTNAMTEMLDIGVMKTYLDRGFKVFKDCAD